DDAQMAADRSRRFLMISGDLSEDGSHRGRGRLARVLKDLRRHVFGIEPKLLGGMARNRKDGRPGHFHRKTSAAEAEGGTDSACVYHKVGWVEPVRQIQSKVRLTAQVFRHTNAGTTCVEVNHRHPAFDHRGEALFFVGRSIRHGYSLRTLDCRRTMRSSSLW